MMSATPKNTSEYEMVETMDAPEIPKCGIAQTFSAMLSNVEQNQSNTTTRGNPMLLRYCTSAVSTPMAKIPGTSQRNGRTAGRNALPNSSIMIGCAAIAEIPSTGMSASAVPI